MIVICGACIGTSHNFYQSLAIAVCTHFNINNHIVMIIFTLFTLMRNVTMWRRRVRPSNHCVCLHFYHLNLCSRYVFFVIFFCFVDIARSLWEFCVYFAFPCVIYNFCFFRPIICCQNISYYEICLIECFLLASCFIALQLIP